MSTDAWEPLEGTPDVFTGLAKELGLDTTRWHFCDVLGLDNELLSLVPDGAAALIFLYPTTDKDIDLYLNRTEDSFLVPNGAHFIRQIVGGTCGTIAVFHALANGTQCHDSILSGTVLEVLLNEDAVLHDADDVMSRSRRFVNSGAVRKAHDAAVAAAIREGGTRRPAAGKRQGRHFITFVNCNNHLLELDGRRPKPTCRKITSEATFLRDAANEVKAIVAATQDPLIHVRCTLVALVPFAEVDKGND
jgi:ubiquitin carboxyl-terminal hydrolase L3